MPRDGNRELENELDRLRRRVDALDRLVASLTSTVAATSTAVTQAASTSALKGAIQPGADLAPTSAVGVVTARAALEDHVHAYPAYEHTQASAATSWTITHNLGIEYPHVVARDEDGVEIDGYITPVSVDELTFTISTALAGTARVTA